MSSASGLSRPAGVSGERTVSDTSSNPAKAPGEGNGQPAPKLTDAIRIGLCGIGRAGFKMVQRDLAKLPQTHVIGGFDLLEERTRQLTEICASRAYSSYKQMLKDPDLELIIVATRSHEHVPMAIAAMKAGKDVLVEKPMALNLAGADRLISTAKKLGRRLFVRQNRRFDPPFLHAMEIVRSGKIGKLFEVQLRQGGFQRRSDWQTIKAFGGGQLLNWGPHVVDWGLQFIGGKAVSIWSDLKRIAAAGDAEDHVKLLLRGESGIIADIEVSGANAFPQTPWRLLGSAGTLVIDAKNQCQLKYFNPSELPEIKASDQTPEGRSGSHFSSGDEIKWIEEQFPVSPAVQPNFWIELYNSIRHGAQFPITLEEARETMQVITAAKRGTGF